jgi:hypothetical protein
MIAAPARIDNRNIVFMASPLASSQLSFVLAVGPILRHILTAARAARLVPVRAVVLTNDGLSARSREAWIASLRTQ